MCERENEFDGGRMSCEQKFCLLEFMENHPDLTKCKFKNYEEKKTVDALWEILSNQLNSLGGPKKNAVKWKRTWVQLKYKCKRRNTEIQVARSSIRDGVAPTPLSNLERRTIAIMSADLVPDPDALQKTDSELKQGNEHDYCIYDEADTKISITENEINEKNTCTTTSTPERIITNTENESSGETSVDHCTKIDKDAEFNQSICKIVHCMEENNLVLKEMLQERKEANALLRLQIQERKETNLLFKELLNILKNK